MAGQGSLIMATVVLGFVMFPLFEAQWIRQTDPELPEEKTQMAVGHYNGSIYLLGERDLIEYDIASNEFIEKDIGLSDYVTGYSVYYTQYNETALFTIDGSDAAIWIFNLQSLEQTQISEEIPIDPRYFGCIASSQDTQSLYITGGWNSEMSHLDDVQVFEMTTASWLGNVPSTSYSRAFHGCVVDEISGALYVIGGKLTATIEYINAIDIQNEVWTLLNDSLPEVIQQFGIVAFDGIIFIIGGYDDPDALRTVYTIDTVTGALDTFSSSLPYAVENPAMIVVDGTIYGFGGTDHDGDDLDSWFTYNIPTMAPTMTPTFSPTMAPIQLPTVYPTQSPTASPSSDGTLSPSTSPITKSDKSSNGGGSSLIDNIHWIILGVVMAMLCCMSSLVGYLLYKRRGEKEGKHVKLQRERGISGSGSIVLPSASGTDFGMDSDGKVTAGVELQSTMSQEGDVSDGQIKAYHMELERTSLYLNPQEEGAETGTDRGDDVPRSETFTPRSNDMDQNV